MSEAKRTYRMRDRAKSQEETRKKIVEAAMHLHEEVGPRATTISAIAERAGVQRLTVYRHFPDETAVFQACTSHWLSLNPPPDPGDWAGIADARSRFKSAIGAFYGYYSKTERMWTAAYRDVDEVPALQQPMAEIAAFLKSVGDDLIAALDPKGSNPALAATVRHGLQFATWADLESQGLSEKEKTDLVMDWLTGTERN